MKQFNSIEEIYNGVEPEAIDGGFQCPVCSAFYKRRSTMVNHLKKQDCFNAVAMFKGTIKEKHAFEFFKQIIGSQNATHRATVASFRKSNLYRGCIKFILFCTLNEVQNKELYYAFVRDKYQLQHATAVLFNACLESKLAEFRLWLFKNPSYIDSMRFIETAYEDACPSVMNEEDWKHFVLAVRKAHVSLLYYLESTGETMESLEKKVPAYYYELLLEHYQLLGVKRA